MLDLIIKNGQCYIDGELKDADVAVKDGKIHKIGEVSEEAKETINAEGQTVLPGCIDTQTHFREPGSTDTEDLHSGSRAAIAGGITSVFEMPNTNPQTTTIDELKNKFKIANNNSYANYSFMFGGTNDNLAEIKKIDSKKVAGLKLFLGSSTGNMLVDDETVLKEIFLNTDLLISVHSEDEKIINDNLREYKSKYGSNIPFDCHPKIRSEEACLRSTQRILKLAKETGARLHVFHLSTKSESQIEPI
mgnify:CR=1 FL=1